MGSRHSLLLRPPQPRQSDRRRRHGRPRWKVFVLFFGSSTDDDLADDIGRELRGLLGLAAADAVAEELALRHAVGCDDLMSRGD